LIDFPYTFSVCVLFFYDMPSKLSRTPKSKDKPASGSPSLNRKPTSLPKTKPPHANPHYLVVDTTIPFHIFSDRSLFTTYVPSRKLYRTVFGTDIIIEGIGDVHVRVVVRGTSIMFRFRDAWHIPSSPHHFLSCSTLVSLGHQVMIAGCSPRMIYSHKRRLVEPTLPKYIPFTRVDGLIILKFNIPVLSPQPASPTTQSTTDTALSLPASLYYPFAGLSFNQNLLSSPTPPHILDPSRLGPLGSSYKLDNILSVVVDDVANGGASAASARAAVAGIVQGAVADGGAAHDVTDVVVVDGGAGRAAHDVMDVVVVDGGAAHDVSDVVVADGVAAHNLTDVVVDEHDGVAMMVVPTQVSIPPQPASTTSHSAAQTVLSLQASTFIPFAGLATLAFEQKSLPTPHQVYSPRFSASEGMAAANVRGHADVMLDTSSDVALHGGADVLVGVDAGFSTK
jgi:hypothetical protein